MAKPLTVVQMLPGLEEGGVEQGTLEMGRFLAATGHRSIVISTGGRLVKALEDQGSTHVTWSWIGEKSPRCLYHVLPLRRLLIRETVDILHLRSRLPAWVGYLAWKSLPSSKKPRLVTTFHGFYSINPYSAIMARGEGVIAISKIVKDHIADVYKVSGEKIHLIYRGIDDSVFHPDRISQDRIETLKAKWRIRDADPFVIMLPGRLTRLKGHDLFIKSLAKINHLDWVAICVGDRSKRQSYVAELENLIDSFKMREKIKFVGYCDDMPAAYMIADVVVSTSSKKPEAFGRTAVEAQAMGKPVIATAHGGSLETVLHGETGWLVAPDDIDGLAQTLKWAIEHPQQLGDMKDRCLVWIQENFTTRIMCERTVGLYKQLLHQK